MPGTAAAGSGAGPATLFDDPRASSGSDAGADFEGADLEADFDADFASATAAPGVGCAAMPGEDPRALREGASGPGGGGEG